MTLLLFLGYDFEGFSTILLGLYQGNGASFSSRKIEGLTLIDEQFIFLWKENHK